MPRVAKEMTALDVKRLSHPGGAMMAIIISTRTGTQTVVQIPDGPRKCRCPTD